ncbi:MAG: CRISPR-associated helicase Cas3' [Ignisphaera sp.]
MSILQLYMNACETLGWTPRKLIEEALRRLDEGVNPLIVKLPTGYGKTSITLSMGLASQGEDNNWLRVIHVLPMRSIVDDVEMRLRKIVREINFSRIRVYKQYMGSPMTPFYCGKGIVVTTLDTFMMNFFKVPASEFRKLIELGYSHYDIPRANIYSSAVVFDEFHLLSNIGSLDEELKSLASILSAIRALCEVGVPVVISTATLPEILIETIRTILKNRGIEISEQNILRWGELRDQTFEDQRKAVKVSLEIIEEHEITDIVRKNTERKILIVVNKVERAVKIFRHISQDAILLHGRLREDVKKKRIEEIDNARIIVATQVVEAGLDKSFDILITDPCPLDRFIQRTGRVARFEDSSNGDIYVIDLKDGEQYSGVYSEELVLHSMKNIERLCGREYQKLEFEESLIEKMEHVYTTHVDQQSLLDYRRLRILIDLDEQPILGREDAKEAIINLRGFTNTFGLVTVFDASEICKELSYEYSVGVPEQFAKKILESTRMVVMRERSMTGHNIVESYVEEARGSVGEFQLIVLKKKFIDKLLNSEDPLTISLLKYGIEGVVVERIDPLEGLVWV